MPMITFPDPIVSKYFLPSGVFQSLYTSFQLEGFRMQLPASSKYWTYTPRPRFAQFLALKLIELSPTVREVPSTSRPYCEVSMLSDHCGPLVVTAAMPAADCNAVLEPTTDCAFDAVPAW